MQGLDFDKLESILAEAGLLNEEKLDTLRKLGLTNRESIERLLLSEENVNYREALELIAQKMGVGFVDLEDVSVNSEAVDALEGRISRKYSVFPFDIRDNLLFLAMQNPDDIFLIDEIKVYTQMEIKPFLADFRLISREIESYYPPPEDEEEDAEDMRRMPESSVPDNIEPGFPSSYKIEDFIGGTLKKYLLPENIIAFNVDTQDRFITITLKARY